jgi:hypothetical protein
MPAARCAAVSGDRKRRDGGSGASRAALGGRERGAGEGGRGRRGGAGDGRRGRGEEKGGGRLEVGDGPDRWAPPVGGCVKEREGSGAYGPAGAMGRRGFVGRGVGLNWVCFVFFFFFFFKSFLKPIFQTIFKSNILHLFKFSHKFLQLFLQAFHKPFLTIFQT